MLVLGLEIVFGVAMTMVLADHWKITPIYILISELIAMMIGYYLLAAPGSGIPLLFEGGVLATTLGWYFNQFSSYQRNARRSADMVACPSATTVKIFASMIILVVIYQLISTGVVAFSSNVAVSRFDVTKSGFLGIPSRIYLYGFPFLLFYLTLYHKQEHSKTSRRWMVAAWILYIMSQLASGFKGALLTCLFQYLLVKAFMGNPVRINKVLSWRGVILLSAVGGYAMIMSTRLAALHLVTTSQIISYLLNRLTIIAAEPGYYAITVLSNAPHAGLYILTDFEYFIREYTHMPLGNVFPLDQIVSSHLYGTPLSHSAFLVPVTVGAFGDLYLDFGALGALFGMFFFGVVYSVLYSKAMRSRSLFSASSYGLAVWMTYVFILNGGLAYALINCIASIAILALLHQAARLLSEIIEQSRKRLRLGGRTTLPYPGAGQSQDPLGTVLSLSRVGRGGTGEERLTGSGERPHP